MYNILHIEQSGFFSKLLEKIVKENLDNISLVKKG